MMKKQLVIVGITLVLFVGLSGCNENSGNNNENKFVGKWTNLEAGFAIGIFDFYSNGSVKTTWIVDEEVLSTHSATWEVKGDRLLVNGTDGAEGDYNFIYSFSNDKTLVLTEEYMGQTAGPYTYRKS